MKEMAMHRYIFENPRVDFPICIGRKEACGNSLKGDC
jgi:hypothetical protein